VLFVLGLELSMDIQVEINELVDELALKGHILMAGVIINMRVLKKLL